MKQGMLAGVAEYPLNVLLLVMALALVGCDGSVPGEDGGVPEDGAAADASDVCIADDSCDDGLFCNGAERCLPDDESANEQGCVGAEAEACITGQTCDEDGNRCQTECDISGDADGDGHDSMDCDGDDCDDGDPDNYPGNTEVCDAGGHNEDCDPTTLGVDGDGDGDGHLRHSCCNGQTDGTTLCGDDCDDSEMSVNPDALEVCDSGVDNDCNGLADAADGVCVPCDDGYRGFDGSCVDVDECSAGAPCGGAVGAACTNIVGSYVCTCPSGYTHPPVGGTCEDMDECMGAPCGSALGTACMNLPGDYACTCPLGYLAPATGGTCADIDECIGAPCGGSSSTVGCANVPGSYSCNCQPGFGAPATGGSCTDVNECLDALTCGRGLAYTDCTNALGGYSCTCSGGYDAPVSGGSCLLVNSALSGLLASMGALAPAFSPSTMSYTLELPAGSRSIRLTPTVLDPTGVTSLQVDGAPVTSGATSAPIEFFGWQGPRSVEVSVTTETGATATYTVRVSRRTTFVKASNAGNQDRFGKVLALSADGATLAIGAPWEDSPTTGIDSTQGSGASRAGAVYVYRLVSGVWAEEAYVKASNTDNGDSFGRALALSADGSTLVVGASLEASRSRGVGADQSDNTSFSVGAVYVFTRTDSTWSQQEYIKASDAWAGNQFATSLALSSNGDVLAVGANVGRVYIFTRSGSSWTERTNFAGDNTESGDSFGNSIALSADGTMLAVAAAGEDSSATGIGGASDEGAPASGAVYIFTGSGGTWSQQEYIKASNTEAGDYFGTNLALSADGSTLAVSSPEEDSSATGVDGNQDDEGANTSGAVYIFTHASGVWAQQAYVKASNADADDYFGGGFSGGGEMALSADGSVLAVGATEEGSNFVGAGLGAAAQANDDAVGAGAVYVFTRVGGNWSQQSYIKATVVADGGDTFGTSVALSSDGVTLVCSAPGESSDATGIDGDQSNNDGYISGAAYIY